MRHCLARIIQDRLRKTRTGGGVHRQLGGRLPGAPLRFARVPQRIAAAATLAAFAVLCLLDLSLGAASDPLADLKAAASALDAKQYAAAATSLNGLAKRLPKLADYAAWLEASAQFGLKNYAAVEAVLDPVWKQAPASPLAAKAYLLSAQASILNNTPGNNPRSAAGDAVALLRKNYAALPQPQGDATIAKALAAAGDSLNAAVNYQKVYYGYPVSAEAAEAGGELTRLHAEMGDGYPPPMPNTMLGRALKMLTAGKTKDARKELEALIPQLVGADRDMARVGLGVADYDTQDNAVARKYLASLESLAPEADAERLYYLVQCARRLNNQEEMVAAMEKLGRLYAASSWRLQALLAVANRYLIDNQTTAYEPLYRACYESFPKDSEAEGCHWKVTWVHYLHRQSDAADLLRAHLRMFPAADSSSAALYFLGRLSEDFHDTNSARTFFSEVTNEYPNQYYAILARDRLTKIPGASNGPPPPTPASEFLRSVAFPKRARAESFQSGTVAAARIERAKLLQQAGLPDLAEQELRFGAKNGDQPYIMALQLASLPTAKPDQAMRFIKAYAGGYLSVPLDAAPRDFWTFAFPLPFRTEVEGLSKQNGLDPFLVAGLIRQESEFNPQAVSRTGARGLGQIQPTTGQDLSRRLKLKSYTSASLFQPHMNLELATYLLKTLIGQAGGREYAALAGYDAGFTHVKAWLTWGDFREPAEFIETIPFTETHGYVQSVLRNADVYRRLYGGPSAPAH
jgi:soluble lytic murein transglycosylase